MADSVKKAFRVQLGSVMNSVLKAAMCEISRIFEGSLCELQTELTQRGWEISALRGRLEQAERRLREPATEIEVEVPDDAWCAPLQYEELVAPPPGVKDNHVLPELRPVSVSLWRIPAIKQEEDDYEDFENHLVTALSSSPSRKWPVVERGPGADNRQQGTPPEPRAPSTAVPQKRGVGRPRKIRKLQPIKQERVTPQSKPAQRRGKGSPRDTVVSSYQTRQETTRALKREGTTHSPQLGARKGSETPPKRSTRQTVKTVKTEPGLKSPREPSRSSGVQPQTKSPNFGLTRMHSTGYMIRMHAQRCHVKTEKDEKQQTPTSPRTKKLAPSKRDTPTADDRRGLDWTAPIEDARGAEDQETSEFQCTTCLKVLSNQSCLIDHIRIHTGEKPLTCDQCPQTFRCHSLLSIHRRKWHRGLYKCAKCKMVFDTLIRRNRHQIKEHKGSSDNCCQICKKNFLSTKRLSTHYEQCHP